MDDILEVWPSCWADILEFVRVGVSKLGRVVFWNFGGRRIWDFGVLAGGSFGVFATSKTIKRKLVTVSFIAGDSAIPNLSKKVQFKMIKTR